VQRHRLALEKFLLAVVVYSIIGFGYLIVNRLVEGRELYELWTPLDRSWPFDERFIWVYLLVYVTPLSLLVFVPRIQDLRRAGLALLLNVAVAFPTFYAYPVTLPRPEDRLTLTWSGYLTDFIWQIDKPLNCFPSIHVSLAFTAAFIVSRFSRAGGLVILGSAMAISVSTLYVRQHYVVDIVAGVLVGGASYWLVFVRDVARSWPLLRDEGAPLYQ
jgi:membrane-associated phospholipid phosphatase